MSPLPGGIVSVKYCLVLIVAAVLCLLGDVRAASVSGVDALVDTFMSEARIAGLSVAVMKGDVVVHARGYGLADVENAVPTTEHTVFRIASLSKQFTAVSVLMLAEQGKIDLDAGIRTYFPEFPATGPQPTVTQLLNHTSGFDFQPAWTAIMPPAETPPSVMHDLTSATLTTLFARATFEYTPGTKFRYNNNAFALLGLLIERVSGVSYASFVKTHIFDPLGMTESYYMDNASIIRNRATGYTFRGPDVINANVPNSNGLYSAGGLGSTALDLMTWRRALTSSRLISEASSKRMTTPGRLTDATPIPYGLGLFLLNLDGRPKIDHYGNTTGFRSEIAYYPTDQLTVVVLSNTNPARTDVLESRISRMLMSMPEPAVTEVAMTPDALRPYAGTYLVTDARISHRSVVTEITWKPDGLYAGAFRLRPIGHDVFVPIGDPNHHYTFAMRNGQPHGLVVEREGRIIADANRTSASAP